MSQTANRQEVEAAAERFNVTIHEIFRRAFLMFGTAAGHSTYLEHFRNFERGIGIIPGYIKEFCSAQFDCAAVGCGKKGATLVSETKGRLLFFCSPKCMGHEEVPRPVATVTREPRAVPLHPWKGYRRGRHGPQHPKKLPLPDEARLVQKPVPPVSVHAGAACSPPGAATSLKEVTCEPTPVRPKETIYEEIARLAKEGKTLREIAAIFGASVSWVSQRLRIAKELNASLHVLIDNGTLSIGIALLLADAPLKHQVTIANEVVRGELTRQEVERYLELRMRCLP